MWRLVLKDFVNERIKRLSNCFKVSTPCFDNHQFQTKKNWKMWELSKVCSHIVLKRLHLARIGRPDIYWSFIKLARAATIWTRTCDKRLEIRIDSRLRLCWRLWRFEIHFGWNSVYLRRSRHFVLEVGCVRNKFQSLWVWTYFLGCWFAHGWYSRSGSLGFWLLK